MKIAIVGAGLTGCLLAKLLDTGSNTVTIFEKSRGCGGRASTKRTQWGQFDLGATVVPAKSAAFKQFMLELCEQNLASLWPSKIHSAHKDLGVLTSIQNDKSDRASFVFKDKMNAPCRQWIDKAKLCTDSLVTELRHSEGKGWQVKIDDVWHNEHFDKVVVTAPWPQSQQLIENSVLPFSLPKFEQNWTSCWSVAMQVASKSNIDIDLVYLKGLAVQTLVKDSAKPNRPLMETTQTSDTAEIWVAQLSNTLSDSLNKVGKDQAVEIANQTLCDLLNIPKENIGSYYAHYWRFARPDAGQTPLGIISQTDVGFYAGGDWSFGASIEAVYEAANSLKQAILAE
jgi:hypothetical protein